MQNTRESNAAAGKAAVFMRSPDDSQKTVQLGIPTRILEGGESANGSSRLILYVQSVYAIRGSGHWAQRDPMSILEVAEQKLKTLNGGEFQVLASRYVAHKYHIDSVHHSGRSFGTLETTTGTPDCFLLKPNGHFIYIECGKRSGKGKTLKKLREDVEHCLSYEKDHPKSGPIDEIVCCYGYPRLSQEDLSSIMAIDVRVVLVGPEEIAEACVTRCPWLAREYLDLTLGTGSIVDVQAFVERNHNDAFAPDMNQSLMGRDDELAELCETCRRSQAVLLSGPSGCGKTRLALEASQILAEELDSDLYVIAPTRCDISEDLRIFLSDDRPKFLFLDDANLLAGLAAVIDFVLERPYIKLLATCRNYAKTSAEEELRHIKGFEQIVLRPLPNESFDCVLDTVFGFENAADRGRIASIVKGNLRLAFLLAESGRDSSIKIGTMRSLLETVYRDKLNDMSDTERRTIAISSILGPHKTENNEQLDTLLNHFCLPREAYISSCKSLYGRELMDATQGFEAVSFEEQNLRDYFLYYSLVDEPVVQLSDLWAMSGGRSLCVRSLQTIVDVFRDQETRQNLSKQLDGLLKGVCDDKEALRVIESFGILLGKAGFSRLCEIVLSMASLKNEEISYSSFDFNAKHPKGGFNSLELSALSSFLESDSLCTPAVSLAFELLRRIRPSDSDVEELFERGLTTGSYHLRNGLQVESETLRLLESTSLSSDGSAEAVFKLLFVRGTLRDVVEYARALNSHEIGFSRYHISFAQQVIELRGRCVQMLLQEFCRDDQWSNRVRKVLLGYRHYPDGDVRLSRETYELISKAVARTLRFESFEECEDIHGFIEAAARAGIDTRSLMLSGLGMGKRFAMEVLDSGRFSDDGVISALVDGASSLSFEDWKELLGLLMVGNQDVHHAYKLDEIIARVIESDELDAATRELIIRSIAASAIYLRRTIDTCTARYFTCFGWQRGRERIVSEAPSYASDWLVTFDQHAVRAGFVPDYHQLIVSLERHGEVLPFATVCEMERIAPGVFAPYIQALSVHSELVMREHRCYLPYSLDTMNSGMSGKCDTEENWMAVANLMCSLSMSSQHTLSEDVVGLVLRKSPSCLQAFFASAARRDSYEELLIPWRDVFDVLGVGSAMESICLIERNAPAGDYVAHHACRRLILNAAEASAAAGRESEFDSWVCEHALGHDDGMVDVISDVITALDNHRRLSLVVQLAHGGISVSLFERMAFGLPFNGVSWSGSQQPIIRRKIEYFNEVESRLLEDGLLKYIPVTREAIGWAEKELYDVTVKEFVDPYTRRSAQS